MRERFLLDSLFPMSEQEQSRWFEAEEPKRGVVAVVHGLNMRPSKMDALAKVLQESHVDVLRVALTGHRGDREALKTVTRMQWLDDIREAYAQVEERAREHAVSHAFVGYSIGGLLLEDLMNETQGRVKPEKVVLLAPGIAFGMQMYFLRFLECLRAFPSLIIPSANLKNYRANTSLPVAAYNALFDSYRHLHARKFVHSNVPTLFILDPKDEFVSASGVQKVVDRFHLDQWVLMHIHNEQSKLRRRYHHLITDSDAVGEEQWKAMVTRIREHLGVG